MWASGRCRLTACVRARRVLISGDFLRMYLAARFISSSTSLRGSVSNMICLLECGQYLSILFRTLVVPFRYGLWYTNSKPVSVVRLHVLCDGSSVDGVVNS